ncbi:unnamed protein product [Paramecium pentaurelia]|uniref:Cation/H+ exchanger transmembrane domain-containing protein n=1 Tax=Paramecium pentaurelia TaxID=43138 RepID=A0A8S1YIY7_9CILI|nr:unnamed protein product [Paramecium pentaurelia]
MSETSFGVVSFTIILILFIYAIAGSYFEHKHIHFIHETGLGIILGVVAGGLFTLIYRGTLYYIYEFNESFFFYILLPIIIFAGGYNLNKRRFFQNFLYINLFGLLGTLLTFLLIVCFTFLISDGDLIKIWGSDTSIKLKTEQIMIFAATICATDSVAALTMIKPNKYPKLFSVVFGEGMVNDAVSIILYISVDLLSGKHDTILTVSLEFCFLFILEFFCSLVVGLFFGVLASILFKYFRFITESVILEMAIIIYIAYGSFTMCELLGLSGVLSVLATGALMAYYNIYNLSSLGQVASKITVSTLSLICEAFIYIYLGLSMWILSGYQNSDDAIEKPKCSWTFLVLELLICFFSRGISMVILSGIAYLIKGKEKFKLSIQELNIIWFAGLIRGSVAYALITKLQISDPEDLNERYQVEVIKTTVLFMVIITTIILGAMMPFYIKLNLKQKVEDSNKKLLQNYEIESGYRRQIQNKFKYLDDHYFKYWMIFNYQNRKSEILRQQQEKQQDEDSHSKIGLVSQFQSKFTGNQNIIFYVEANKNNPFHTESLIEGIDDLDENDQSDQPNLMTQISQNNNDL